MGGWGLLLEDSSGGANYAVGESRSGQGSWGISQQVVGCGRFLHLQNKLKLQVFFIMLLIFKEIFELCMHFYIVILYHLSQLDLLVTLNAASRKHLLQSWDPVMLYLLPFIFIRKKPSSLMHESSSTIGAFQFYHSNHFMQNFEYMHSLFSILQQRCNISYSDYRMLTAKWIYAETTQHHTCQGYYVSWII